jgi:hypothetical protein
MELIAQYNRDMSESIESRDSIWILQRALGHLKAQGKNVSNDDDVFELQMHAINVFRAMKTHRWQVAFNGPVPRGLERRGL